MKLFFEYEAQHPNHDTEYWTIIRDEAHEEIEEDYLSPLNKTEASYCLKYYPSNLPIITFLPASRARELSDLNHQYKDLFFLLITNRENTIEIISEKSYSWEEATELIKKYTNLLFPVLIKLLPKKGFYIRNLNSNDK